MPVSKEELLLRHTQEAGDEREQSQPVLGLGAGVQSVAVQHLHKVLQTRDVHFVLNGLFRKKGSQSTYIMKE